MPVHPISAAAIFSAGDQRSFEEQRPEILEACKQFITSSHEEIRQRHAAGASGTEVVHQLSAVMDAMVSTLFNGILGLMGADGKRLTGHLTLAAVGGYGRGELNPYSDVDIMFLHDGSVPVEAVEAFAQKLLYFLIVLCLLVLLLSGIVIWRAYFAFYFPIWAIRLASDVHAVCAFVLICGIITHIYAAIWIKGSVRAMTRGTVTRGWAWKHHRAWYKQLNK